MCFSYSTWFVHVCTVCENSGNHFSGVSTGRVQIAFIKDEGRHDLKSERYTVAKTSSRFCCEKWGPEANCPRATRLGK